MNHFAGFESRKLKRVLIRATAKKFLAAAQFMELLSDWGEIDEEVGVFQPKVHVNMLTLY